MAPKDHALRGVNPSKLPIKIIQRFYEYRQKRLLEEASHGMEDPEHPSIFSAYGE
jgi:hypothetical protein